MFSIIADDCPRREILSLPLSNNGEIIRGLISRSGTPRHRHQGGVRIELATLQLLSGHSNQKINHETENCGKAELQPFQCPFQFVSFMCNSSFPPSFITRLNETAENSESCSRETRKDLN